ncbi:glycosyltransferase family 87 protein [Azoarcus sp. KH32C]|uniref:glycosyltransferase family 87 protein n=1 Tax=Azoarcus sp. KH32C TaxID=748247 RepID=UPI0002386AF4|nr:glycosyltransferase family 87 protein [Azoarcus sp. KH32C]BAL22720.1 hypothetical protein AZKH_0374 [Azoarcus sp. KH32C]
MFGYAVFIGGKFAEGYRDAARGEVPLYTDFTSTYAASLLVREVPAEFVYLPRSMIAAGKAAAHRIYDNIDERQAANVGFAPWMYPPTFILLVIPLAYLPYLLAWAGWLAVTALPYLATIRRILPGHIALPFALAAPPAFFNLMYGQTGFLTAGLLGLGLLLVRSHPLRAGVLIGLASVKPHFGILVPFALLAGGHWRVFAAAAASVLATVLVSVVMLGDDPWFAFIGTSLFHLDGFTVGAFTLPAMATAWSAARLAGMSLAQAWSIQYAVSALMLILVAAVWWRGRRHTESQGLQAAVLCFATPLALPLTFLYDLVLIVPAAAWLWADMRRHGAGRKEYWILVTGLIALLGVKEFAKLASFQAAPWILSVLLGLALSRFLMAVQRES